MSHTRHIFLAGSFVSGDLAQRFIRREFEFRKHLLGTTANGLVKYYYLYYKGPSRHGPDFHLVLSKILWFSWYLNQAQLLFSVTSLPGLSLLFSLPILHGP